MLVAGEAGPKDTLTADRELLLTARKRRQGIPKFSQARRKAAIEALQGRTAWVDGSCTMSRDVKETLRLWSIQTAPHLDPADVSVIITDDPAKLPPRTKLAAGLSGMWVLSQQFVCSGGRKGACMAYRSYFKMGKKCFITENFRDKHPSLVRVIEDAVQVGRPKCKTTLLEDESVAIDRAKRAKLRGVQADYFILAMKEDRRRFEGLKYVFNAKKFEARAAKLNLSQSFTGMGRN